MSVVPLLYQSTLFSYMFLLIPKFDRNRQWKLMFDNLSNLSQRDESSCHKKYIKKRKVNGESWCDVDQNSYDA